MMMLTLGVSCAINSFFSASQESVFCLRAVCLVNSWEGSHKETKTYQLLAYLDIQASREEMGKL